MNAFEVIEGNPTALSRRGLFSVLAPGAMGCLGCAQVALSAPQVQVTAAVHSPSEKADWTWEEIFQFAYQRQIPLLKQMAEQVGREKFVDMLKAAVDEVVRKRAAGKPPAVRDMAEFAARGKNPPPLMQHALEVEIVEQTPEAYEFRVKRCLWAKVFRDEGAGDIGYAMSCYPDYARARTLNPKLKLIRTKTLMQGGDSCNFRYVWEG